MIFEQRKIGNSTFTIDDAKKAGTKNVDKFPKNMLFARAMSNGVRWYTPDIFNGSVYTPEELEQVTVEVAHTDVTEEKPELLQSNEYFEAMKKALKSKERTMAQLEEKWTISSEIKALLLA